MLPPLLLFKYNAMKKLEPKDRAYRLTRDRRPLSFILPSRHTKRHPLLYFDEDKNVNRPLRYARNQKSPFEDEQDDNAIVEPIIFEDGMLVVPKTNPVLQQMLYYHPMYGKAFEEIDKERDAVAELERIDLEDKAIEEAKSLDIDSLEVLCKAIFGRDTSRMTTPEMKRDIRMFARSNPEQFLEYLSDPMTTLKASAHKYFEEGLISFRKNQREVWWNTKSNKTKMLSIPYGEEPYGFVSQYLGSEKGADDARALEMLASEGGS